MGDPLLHRNQAGRLIAGAGRGCSCIYRLGLRNLWLFGPVIRPLLSSNDAIGPMLRTTTAATLFHAGVKDNVLPSVARATVNFRIFPGDTIDSVVAHVREVVDDDRIALTPSEKRREPPRRSSRWVLPPDATIPGRAR